MAASVVPALIDAIVTQAASALPLIVVTDGVGVTADPGDYLMVGVSDPDDEESSEAAAITQTPMTFGSTRPRQESGVIHMAARAYVGAPIQKTARDAAYAIQEALANVIRGTDSLGVAGVMQLGNGSNLRLLQEQGEYGAVATLLYDVAFDAQI